MGHTYDNFLDSSVLLDYYDDFCNDNNSIVKNEEVEELVEPFYLI